MKRAAVRPRIGRRVSIRSISGHDEGSGRYVVPSRGVLCASLTAILEPSRTGRRVFPPAARRTCRLGGCWASGRLAGVAGWRRKKVERVTNVDEKRPRICKSYKGERLRSPGFRKGRSLPFLKPGAWSLFSLRKLPQVPVAAEVQGPVDHGRCRQNCLVDAAAAGDRRVLLARLGDLHQSVLADDVNQSAGGNQRRAELRPAEAERARGGTGLGIADVQDRSAEDVQLAVEHDRAGRAGVEALLLPEDLWRGAAWLFFQCRQPG